MATPEKTLQRLRDALAEMAAQDAPAVLERARAGARARVQAIATEAFADALLAQLEAVLAPAAPSAAGAFEEPSDAATGTAWYVYGVVAARTAGEPVTGPGIDPRSEVTSVRYGEMAAIVSRVPLSEFDEEELRAHLGDLAWVERVAVAHERVVDELCARSTVIPMRMCTVYRTEAGVREMLVREHDALTRALEELDGRVELGVKAFAAPPPAVAADADAREAVSGSDYMARRRRKRDQAADADRARAALAERIHESLGLKAEASRSNPVHAADTARGGGVMLLNGAYLVPREATAAFREHVAALADELRADGVELAVTGPWPPYNFLPGGIGVAP
jgi:hypothetical protein